MWRYVAVHKNLYVDVLKIIFVYKFKTFISFFNFFFFFYYLPSSSVLNQLWRNEIRNFASFPVWSHARVFKRSSCFVTQLFSFICLSGRQQQPRHVSLSRSPINMSFSCPVNPHTHVHTCTHASTRARTQNNLYLVVTLFNMRSRHCQTSIIDFRAS